MKRKQKVPFAHGNRNDCNTGNMTPRQLRRVIALREARRVANLPKEEQDALKKAAIESLPTFIEP